MGTTPFVEHGVAVIKDVVASRQVAHLRDLQEFTLCDGPGKRSFAVPDAVVALIASEGALSKLAEHLAGQPMRPVRVLYFDKNPNANWAVPWHQDRTIAVARRLDAPGYDTWSIKAGIDHVEPPESILRSMISLRLHIDDGEPGRRWTYCGGATALLGRIIARGTAKPLPDFAREVLFDPLGIGPTEWFQSGDGVHSAASGLRMSPRDLARIGHLMIGGGVWQGRRIVPAAWFDKCITPLVSCDEQRRFGYHWYVGDFSFGTPPGSRLERWWGCFGNGGQRLFVLPELELAVAINAGNYSAHEQWIPPIRVVRDVVLAGLR